MTPPVIHRVAQLDLSVQPWSWPFADERRADIETHFALKRSEKPQLWNGRVLLARHPEFAGDRLRARYFETDFASFLAWRDWGFPDSSVFNGFGMGALQSSDGAFVLGEMAGHTANAGRIYFPSGTPDLDDIRLDAVDMAGSIAREVEEETGLTPADYRAGAHWDCVVSGHAIAMMRILNVEFDRRSAARQDRGQSRPAASARTGRHASGAHDVRPDGGDAAFCHRLYREAVRNGLRYMTAEPEFPAS